MFEQLLLDHMWTVWQPLAEFERSFAKSEADISEWRTVILELTRLRLARGNPKFQPWGLRYNSEILDALRQKRDALVGHVFDPKTDPMWAGQLSFCHRQLERCREESPQEFATKMTEVRLEEDRRRAFEIQDHGEIKPPPTTDRELLSCYGDTVAELVQPLGFSFDPKRSTLFPIYTKRLRNDLRLCLSPEPLSWYPGIGEGKVVLLLSVRSNKLEGLSRSRSSVFLAIDYDELVYNFSRRYLAFKTASELNTILKAKLYLLSCVLESIERCVSDQRTR